MAANESSRFTQTSSAIARRSEATPAYVGRCADRGLIEFVIASNGVRLYPPEAADAVRASKAAGMAKRGRPRNGEVDGADEAA